jgi:hypothetical protein
MPPRSSGREPRRREEGSRAGAENAASELPLGRLERLALAAGRLVTAVLAPLLLFQACATPPPPPEAEDLCRIFSEEDGWYRAARLSYQRWGVPESVQLAVIHQESRFRARARPERRRVLWILPVGRRSSAYGYGQVKDETWADYVRATGRRGADRADFADVADFIGWYGDLIHRRTAVAKHDAYHLYLAYHEGPGGFARGAHEGKAWLLEVARKVEARARLYQTQYLGCRDRLAAFHPGRF